MYAEETSMVTLTRMLIHLSVLTITITKTKAKGPKTL